MRETVTGPADDRDSLKTAQPANRLDHGVRGLVHVGAAVGADAADRINGGRAAVGAVLVHDDAGAVSGRTLRTVTDAPARLLARLSDIRHVHRHGIHALCGRAAGGIGQQNHRPVLSDADLVDTAWNGLPWRKSRHSALGRNRDGDTRLLPCDAHQPDRDAAGKGGLAWPAVWCFLGYGNGGAAPVSRG